MNNLDKSINDLKEYLNNNKTIIRYLELKELINNSKEIKQIKNEISYIKKCEMNDDELNRLKELNKELDNNILILEFIDIKNQVESIIKEIKEGLEI